jgi:catechol-2,3-dioxygenase
MINLSGIGHVLLRVADEEASKRFTATCWGFASPSRIETRRCVHDFGRWLPYNRHRAHPHHRTRRGRGTETGSRTSRSRLRYAALRRRLRPPAQKRREIQRAADHVCQRSVYFADPDSSLPEIYYEMPRR